MSRDYLGLTAVDLLRDGRAPRPSRRARVEIPEPLLRELEALARDRGTSAAELVRRFVGLGLFLARAQGSTETSLIVKEGARERELVLL
jgi:hypothetical protein